eukprot:413435-Pelagomonas_calceolata.AAC.1
MSLCNPSLCALAFSPTRAPGVRPATSAPLLSEPHHPWHVRLQQPFFFPHLFASVLDLTTPVTTYDHASAVLCSVSPLWVLRSCRRCNH